MSGNCRVGAEHQSSPPPLYTAPCGWDQYDTHRVVSAVDSYLRRVPQAQQDNPTRNKGIIVRPCKANQPMETAGKSAGLGPDHRVCASYRSVRIPAPCNDTRRRMVVRPSLSPT